MTTSDTQPWVLQLCHGYGGPFLDCARQYAALFKGSPYKVCTVYLTGVASPEVERGSASDEVIFLGYDSKDVRGLKLRAIRDIRRLVRTHSFKFCIAHRAKPVYVALLGSSLPVIGVYHAFGAYERRSRRVFANLFRKRLKLLAVSNAVRDDIRQQLPDWPEENIQTLYNRIDVETVQAEQISREAARSHLGLPQDAWVAGNVGRLHPDKDQATLIRGFAQALPNLPEGSLLVLIGKGRLEDSLKTLAADSGVADSVRFLGQVPDVRRYFKAFDAFVLSSDHEPFGMVLLEAMAAGVPIIANDSGGAPEVVGDTGKVVPAGDSVELAHALSVQATMEEPAREKMQSRLEQLFSDSSVRTIFWTYLEAWLRK